VRSSGASRAEEAPLDTVLQLLFAIAANQTDKAELLARSEARWLGADSVAGVPVDVLLGPAVPPKSPAPATPPASAGASSPRPGTLAAQGGAVRYWLDRNARLRRLEAVLSPDVPVRLDFERSDRHEVAAISELGGRAITPRRPTAAEAETLARLRQRNRTQRAATLRLALPGKGGNLITAAGWLDWRSGFAYLALRDTDTPAKQTLIRADNGGVAVLEGGKPTANGQPPLPPPRAGWHRTDWLQRAEDGGATDLDLLLSEALALAGTTRDDPEALRDSAMWLRADTINGQPVAVYEMPKPAEGRPAAGRAKLRYWVDATGALRRIEVRCRAGGFGRLDLAFSRSVPYVPPPASA
jgi:hypothetical protein